MLKKLMILFSVITFSMVLISCGGSPTTSGSTTDELTTIDATTTEVEHTTEELLVQEPTVDSGYLVADVQDGLILHAWNWSLATIEENLENIAIAGFSTVQISPMQPQKDYFGITSWGEGWWRLYQPLGFVIATADHSIGTRTDLVSLTDAADDYGIKIIVDVVANHLASASNAQLDADVEEYEPEIYQQNLIRTGNGLVSDSSVYQVTRGSLGELVDLQTETAIVQQAVLDLLKDYVDAGVDGFRFDAAKHIETDNDGDYASDFWPTVIEGVRSYTTEDLYIYGEILNTVGTGRSYSDYTQYMSVTDNNLSSTIRNAVLTQNTAALASLNYLTGVAPNQTVLWAESHDTFADGSTDNLSETSLTKVYAIEASRKDVTTLYFARPASATLMGEIGTYTWQSQEVAEVNRFHNFFVDTEEYLSVSNGFFLTERYSDELEGVVIVDVEGNNTLDDVPVYQLSDGYYKDQISGEWFTVVDGKISGTVGTNGVAVVYNNPFEAKPVVYVSDDGLHGTFTDTKDITIYSYNTTNAYYSINDGEQVNFSGNIDITLSHPEENAIVTLEVHAFFDAYEIVRTYTYEKSNTVVEQVVVNNLDSNDVDGYTIVAWTWPTGTDGQWASGTYNNGTFTFDLPTGYDNFLLVLFAEGTTTFVWNNALFQTGDIEVPSNGVYDGSALVWND